MTNGWQGTPRLIPKQRFLAHSDVRATFGESFVLRSDPGHILQLLVCFFIPYGERYLKNGQIPVILDFDIEHPRLSSSSLASSTEAQRPSRFEFISCESLRTILAVSWVPIIYSSATNGNVVTGCDLQMGNCRPPDLQLFYAVESIQDGCR